MHVPAEMLNGSICPVSATLSAVGIAGSVYALYRRKEETPEPVTFALVSTSVFCIQMLNYPIWNGISGHLIGGVLAASLLGAPAAVLSISLVLLLQTLLFADGGLFMLGANVLNMAILGAGAGGLLRGYLQKRNHSDWFSTGFAAFASVLLAVLALGVELLASGKASVPILGTLFGVHLVLAVLEGVATVLILKVLPGVGKFTEVRKIYVPLSILIGAGILVAPFASEFPDAFEWTMANYHLLPDAPDFVNAPFLDYVALNSSLLAGLIGAAATALLAFFLAVVLRRNRSLASVRISNR